MFKKVLKLISLKLLTGFLIAIGLVGGVYLALAITGPMAAPTGSPATDTGLLKTFINSLVGPSSDISLNTEDILTAVNGLGGGGSPYIDWNDCQVGTITSPYATYTCSSGYVMVDSNCSIQEWLDVSDQSVFGWCEYSGVNTIRSAKIGSGNENMAFGTAKCCKYIVP